MSTDLVDPMVSVRTYLDAEKASNTRKGNGTAWADFAAWRSAADLRSLPAEPATVARYLAQLADGGRKSLDDLTPRPCDPQRPRGRWF